MSYKELPSKELLEELLLADFDTGKLYWKERDSKWFKGTKNALFSASAWNSRNANKEAFYTLDNKKYFVGNIFSCVYKAHRIIYKMYHGVDPDQVDHINGVCSDNRISNLRSVNCRENKQNQKLNKNNTSGFQGVRFDKKRRKWLTQIKSFERQLHVGYYENFEEAVKARKEAQRKHGYHPNHGRI